MNEFAERVAKAFRDSPTATHKLLIVIELPEIDARNDEIEEIIEGKLQELSGLRSLSVEKE